MGENASKPALRRKGCAAKKKRKKKTPKEQKKMEKKIKKKKTKTLLGPCSLTFFRFAEESGEKGLADFEFQEDQNYFAVFFFKPMTRPRSIASAQDNRKMVRLAGRIPRNGGRNLKSGGGDC